MRTSLATVAGMITISGLAFMLIAIVIARSPYTHGNLSPEGYGRTEVAIVGQEYNFDGLGLADPQLARTGDPVQDGRALFFQYGCASCHGFQGQGGIVGEDLDEASPSEIRREARDGPEGMPAYSSPFLSDEDLELIVAFLTSAASGPSEATGAETSSLPPGTRDGPDLKGGTFLEKISALLAAALDRTTAEKTGRMNGRLP